MFGRSRAERAVALRERRAKGGGLTGLAVFARDEIIEFMGKDGEKREFRARGREIGGWIDTRGKKFRRCNKMFCWLGTGRKFGEK